MSKKSLLIGTVAVFVFISIFEWIFHASILGSLYRSTAELWRPEADMDRFMIWLTLGQLLFSIMFCLIFAGGYQNRGLMEGARYGLLIGIFFISTNLVFYAVQPLPANIVIYWSIGGLVETIIAGMILAAIARPKSA